MNIYCTVRKDSVLRTYFFFNSLNQPVAQFKCRCRWGVGGRDGSAGWGRRTGPPDEMGQKDTVGLKAPRGKLHASFPRKGAESGN